MEKMHFIISQTMMKYYHDQRSRYAMARHVALASRLVKSKVEERRGYRKILWDAGETAAQSGARPTALWYFRHCVDLLQDDPWNEDHPDTYYDETLRLYVATADMIWLQGHNMEAMNLLDAVFVHGRTPVCRSKAWVVKAKIYAQMGHHPNAMSCLLTCLEELGVYLRSATTYEQCDIVYKKLRKHIWETDFDRLVHIPICHDDEMVTIGEVMSEAMVVTFWDDALTFYQMALEMMNLHLSKGGFDQISVACSHLAMIALGRFKDLEFAVKLTDLGVSLFGNCLDPFTQSRATVTHNLFVSHLRVPIASTLPILENSLEESFAMGDPYLSLCNVCCMATTRLYLGHDMLQLELFCDEGPEDYPSWKNDTRVGVCVLATRQVLPLDAVYPVTARLTRIYYRQVARALQGKTYYWDPESIMSDEWHRSWELFSFLDKHASNVDRPRVFYWGLAMIPLFIFGHHRKIIEMGTQIMRSISKLWSVRVAYCIHFYVALSYLTLHVDNPHLEFFDGEMDIILNHKEAIDFARSACDVNYGMWALLLEALMCEMRKDYATAIQSFEVGIPMR